VLQIELRVARDTDLAVAISGYGFVDKRVVINGGSRSSGNLDGVQMRLSNVAILDWCLGVDLAGWLPPSLQSGK
jgi:hypothetical protein